MVPGKAISVKKTRTYMDVRFDVTDLSERERGALALEVAVQAEESGDSQDENYHPPVDSPEIAWNEVEVDEERYTFSGWFEGESDCDPPEPGKQWLEIYEDGEEMAVVVHRNTGHNDGALKAKKFDRARKIVFVLNFMHNYVGDLHSTRAEEELQEKSTARSYLLTVCVDGVPEGRNYDAIEETIEAAGEAICRFEENPTKVVSLAVSDTYEGYVAGPPKVLTAEEAMSILFGWSFDEPGFDARTAQFISGSDVCSALASHFCLSDEEINTLAMQRRQR